MKSKFDLESGLIATQQAVVHGSGANCDGMRFPSIFVRLDNSDVLPWIIENVFPNKIIVTTPQPTTPPNTLQTCTDYESEGYKCVPNDDCEGSFSPRSVGLEDSDPTCSDPSQTCCHQERMKKGTLLLDLPSESVGENIAHFI
jgi:hypothetical protein